MSSFKPSFRAPLLCAALLAVALTTACGGGAQSATPSSLAASPTTFDGTTVSVSGTVKAPHTRKTRRGTALMYQLCDSACINVFQFGADATTVAEGSTASVTGTFHASFGRVRQITNVLVVGGRGGRGYGGSPQPSASPT